MKNYPSISIIARTLNTDLLLFTRVLESVKIQEYPKKLIEYIIIDGGSTNGTLELANRYGCKIIVRKDIKEQSDARASIGIKKAKGDLILDLEADNIICSKNWLQEMSAPFMENKNIFCSFSMHNTFEKNMSAMTRYCALIGSPDPILYYLDKSEKVPLTQSKYHKGKIIKETKEYYIVEFNESNLPTLGANGSMFLRKAINKVNKDPLSFTHTDAIMEAVKLGYRKFGVVKNSIIHVANPKILPFVQRKLGVKETFYDGMRGKRTYLVYNPNSLKDRINLFKCIIFSLTIAEPLFESIRGYFKLRDRAWFLHPVMSFLMVLGYGYSEGRFLFKRMIQG